MNTLAAGTLVGLGRVTTKTRGPVIGPRYEASYLTRRP